MHTLVVFSIVNTEAYPFAAAYFYDVVYEYVMKERESLILNSTKLSRSDRFCNFLKRTEMTGIEPSTRVLIVRSSNR